MIDINVNSNQIFSLFMEHKVPVPCGLLSSVNFYDSSVKDIVSEFYTKGKCNQIGFYTQRK